jgi:hypothetical protein
VKLDLVFRRSDIDWLNFPIKAWSISSHDIDHIQSGEGKGRRVAPAAVLVIRPRLKHPGRRVQPDPLPVMRHDERDALQKS